MALLLKLGTLILLSILGTQARINQPEVETSLGRIRGITVATTTYKSVDVYYGIPYAQPPVGELRFKRPRPITSLDRIFNATTKPYACPQALDTFFGEFPGATMWNPNTERKEDCLKLNIWVPESDRRNLAVMVWIYGGGFYSGSSMLDVYDGKILAAEEEVIVASINYRVGALGFLYFDREDAPGNMGLLDQMMAIQWVRDNIASFGGDPNKITLFGESAGAASVSLHLLSPLSRNLFDRAIFQSASATAPWAFASTEKMMNHSYNLAKELRCGGRETDLNVLMDCLKQKSANSIAEVYLPDLVPLEPGFVPVVDNYFLNKAPAKYLSDGDFKKCPLLAGSNKDEGTYFLVYKFPEDFPKREGVLLNLQRFIELLSEAQKILVSSIIDSIVAEYEDAAGNYVDTMDKVVGDKYFTCPVNEVIDAYLENGLDNLYMYHFLHRSSNHLWPQWMGVLHGDEIAYVFGAPLIPQNGHTADEINFSSAIMKYWANFAKTGNVNKPKRLSTHWPKYNIHKTYLSLDITMAPGKNLRSKQCNFWKRISKK